MKFVCEYNKTEYESLSGGPGRPNVGPVHYGMARSQRISFYRPGPIELVSTESDIVIPSEIK